MAVSDWLPDGLEKKDLYHPLIIWTDWIWVGSSPDLVAPRPPAVRKKYDYYLYKGCHYKFAGEIRKPKTGEYFVLPALSGYLYIYSKDDYDIARRQEYELKEAWILKQVFFLGDGQVLDKDYNDVCQEDLTEYLDGIS